MPKRAKREVNWERTFEKYKQRMIPLVTEHVDTFNEAYISSFEIYSTVSDIPEGSEMDCFAGVLLRLVRSLNPRILGATSERKSGGEYICSFLLDGTPRADANVIYVGKFSYFSGHEKSPFSPLAKDFVYHDPPSLDA